MVLAEGTLERAHIVALGQTLDGDDFAPIRLNGQYQARADSSAVDDNRAGTAHAVFTAHMCASQL
jgi:hypothetical protein